MTTDSRDITGVLSDSGHPIGWRTAERPPRLVQHVLAWQGTPRFTITGSLALQQPEPIVLPAGLLKAGASLRVRAYFTAPAGVSPKTIGYVFNGSGMISGSLFAAASTQARIDADAWVTSAGLINHSAFLAPNVSGTGVPNALVSYTPAAEVTVAVVMQLQNAADSCTLEAWRIEIVAPE